MHNLPPTVCLDAGSVRRIREEKRLTQLYVAKVVGVTTDTISRWENNRYPTVKRENALRLAEALEVSVTLLVQGHEDAGNLGEVPVAARSPRRLWLGLAALVIVMAVAAIAFLVFYRGQAPPVQSALTAQRLLAAYGAPGNIVPVRVRIDTAGESRGFILREHFPPGWKLIESSPPASSIDNEEGTARWMVKPGENRTVITYLLRVDPREEMGVVSRFQGEVVVSSAGGKNPPSSVLGATELNVSPILWADLNADSSVDDAEMLDASYVVEEMSGVHLDWKQLESIWDAGKYRWDGETQQFLPVKDVP